MHASKLNIFVELVLLKKKKREEKERKIYLSNAWVSRVESPLKRVLKKKIYAFFRVSLLASQFATTPWRSMADESSSSCFAPFRSRAFHLHASFLLLYTRCFYAWNTISLRVSARPLLFLNFFPSLLPREREREPPKMATQSRGFKKRDLQRRSALVPFRSWDLSRLKIKQKRGGWRSSGKIDIWKFKKS